MGGPPVGGPPVGGPPKLERSVRGIPSSEVGSVLEKTEAVC